MITSFGLPVSLTAGRRLISGLLDLPRDPLVVALILTMALTATVAACLVRPVRHRCASRRRPNS
ncbi:MAG TPA: hypothetical protein VGL48_18585 [Acidimicrobiales bacterium]|jgi:hypothetical protein